MRDHLKKFCFNNEVNYKIAHSLAATLNAENNKISQNRSQIHLLSPSDKLLSPANSHNNYLSNSGSNFNPNSKGNYVPSNNPYSQQERFYVNNNNNFNQANANKENSYGSRMSDGHKSYNPKANLISNSSSYVNNVMPVNTKTGLDAFNSNLNNNSALNSNYASARNLSKQNPASAAAGVESPYDRKSVLPANKFSNNENFQPENTFLNSPYNAIGKLNNKNNINSNRSFNNYKTALDEERAGTADSNNPNISINIINHNYSHYFVNPEEEKKRYGAGNKDFKDIKLEKYNTSPALKSNNLEDKYNTNNYQNRPPLNNMNYNPASLQNYSNVTKDANEKKSKYSNINLFRSGNPNMNNSFGNTNNNINMSNNPYLSPQYPDNKSALGKNPTNNNYNNNVNYETYRGADLNNFDKKLLQNPRQSQPQDLENRMFSGNNNENNYNNANNNNQNNLNRYNSFISDKYSSKLSSNNSRPSSAVLVGQSNSNHLSRYPISSQQIQSFINNNQVNSNNNDNNNNNNNYPNASGFYSKEKIIADNTNNIKNNMNSNNNLQPKSPNSNNNFALTNIDRKNPQFREPSANPNLRSFNSKNFSSNNYTNQNYYQMNNSKNNTNLINNPQKQKFGNNLTSSVNNFDMDLSRDIGNRTSRPATSLNEKKNTKRDFSLGAPKRNVNTNLVNNFNPNNNNNNNSQGNSFLIKNINDQTNSNTRTPNSNYGMINKSFNALTAKDLVYEEYNSNRESLMKKNYNNNVNGNMAISRSVERSKFKPSTPSYPTSNNYFSQNHSSGQNSNNINNNYHQKQISENNYSSLINNFRIYTSNIFFI